MSLLQLHEVLLTHLVLLPGLQCTVLYGLPGKMIQLNHCQTGRRCVVACCMIRSVRLIFQGLSGIAWHARLSCRLARTRHGQGIESATFTSTHHMLRIHHLCSACTRAHCCRYHIKAVNTIRLALLNLNDERQFPAVSPVQKHISNFLPF